MARLSAIRAIPVLLAALPIAAAQEGDYVPPVPLHTPPFRAPIETAGLGLEPEVGVEIKVDEKGRVTEVQITSIKPSSRFDAEFEEVTRRTLRTWRYVPARLGDKPVTANLNWIVRFPSLSASADRAPTVVGNPPADAEPQEVFPWRSLADVESRTQDLRRRILGLPQEQRLALLEEQARLAQRHLSPDHSSKSRTPRFLVYADGDKSEIGDVAGANLEALFNTLNELIGAQLGQQPEPYRLVAFVYATEDAYKALAREVTGIEWSAGLYSPAGLLAFHREMPSGEALTGVMLHEGTHAYLDRYLARPGVVFPRWLDEGFAEYIGNSEIRKGKLIPGKTRRLDIYRVPWGLERFKSLTRFELDALKRVVRKGEALSLEELLTAEPSEFYGDKYAMFYSMAWLLVHFLRHGEEGWEEGAFPDLMLYIAEGYPARDAFAAIYGDPLEMEDEFRRYVLRF